MLKAAVFTGVFALMLGTSNLTSLSADSTISMDLRQADLVETLRRLAELGNLNMVIGQDVKGTITLRLENVTAEDALEIILRTSGLARLRKDTVVGILPRDRLLKEQREKAEALDRRVGPFRTEVVTLRYRRASELAPVLTVLLTRWGKISADVRTNTLIIHDVADSPIFEHIGGVN